MPKKKNGSESAEQFADRMNAKFGDLPPLAHILDTVHNFLSRFVVYPSKETHDAHVLWIAHAHVMDAWESTPRIAFLSPEPASGKSRALEVSELSRRSMFLLHTFLERSGAKKGYRQFCLMK
jgi:hypothetical protein